MCKVRKQDIFLVDFSKTFNAVPFFFYLGFGYFKLLRKTPGCKIQNQLIRSRFSGLLTATIFFTTSNFSYIRSKLLLSVTVTKYFENTIFTKKGKFFVGYTTDFRREYIEYVEY